MPNKKAPTKSKARQSVSVVKHSSSAACRESRAQRNSTIGAAEAGTLAPQKSMGSAKMARVEKLAAKLRTGERWGRKDGLAAAQFCIESGMSRTAFCWRFGLSPHRIKYWSDRLEEDAGLAKDEVNPVLAIHPVQVNGGASLPQLKCEPESHIDEIEVITPTGLKIRLGPRFNAATLRRLLEVVEC